MPEAGLSGSQRRLMRYNRVLGQFVEMIGVQAAQAVERHAARYAVLFQPALGAALEKSALVPIDTLWNL